MDMKKVVASQLSAGRVYFLTAFILVAVTTLVGTRKYAPPMETGLKIIAQEIQTDFPKSLDIAITPEGIKGEADYPVVLKTPTSLQNYLPPNFIIIDPNGQEFMLETHQALILVTNDRIVVLSSQGYQELDLASIPAIELNQKSINKLTNNLLQLGERAHLYIAGFFLARGLINALVIWPLYLMILTIVYNITDRYIQQRTKAHLKELVFTFSPLIVLHTILQAMNIRISFVPWFVVAHILLVLYLKGRKLKETNPISRGDGTL